FEANLRSVWLPLTAVPYYFFYGRDLMQAGYALSDLVRVYALNLMLIPVNLAGVIESLRQKLTGRSIAFQRTPRVGGTAGAANPVLVAEYLLPLCAASGVCVDSLHG